MIGQTALPELPVNAPRQPLPRGAWDCHAHVFGPFDRFPLTAQPAYVPPLATAARNRTRLRLAGFENAVMVQGAAHGFENAVTLDALRPGRDHGVILGVGVVDPSTPEDTLAALKAQGMIGLRFTDNGRPPGPGILPLTALGAMVPNLRRLNWQAHIWAHLPAILQQRTVLESAGIPVVLDHMGYPPKGTQVSDHIWRSFLQMLRGNDIWVKLTPHRISDDWPLARDVRPLHASLLETIPDRVIWGSDWPFLHLQDRAPDLGQRIDLFDAWCPDAALRHAIFVTNPARLHTPYTKETP